VGWPLRGVETRLALQPDGEDLGELEVRGPTLMEGYLNLADTTRGAYVEGGWFRTGDVATIGADGGHRIVGRASTDLIKSGGYRIGAGEIEAALLEHPAVSEVAVAGRPDDDLGERVVAWVVLRDDAQASDAELIDHVAGQLAPHKRPRTVRFLAQLPRNELGKVQKRRLRAE
ncbi:MAG: AMP-binding enzyme, partial [Solirubrobacteraceae bacterium]